MSGTIALSQKGARLVVKGHHARAAETFGRAAEEAQRALQHAPDCLVTAALRLEQLDSLMSHATASAARPADAHDALRHACLQLLPAVTAVLQRREAAGTLLPGACRPVEEAWCAAVKRHNLALQGASAEAAEANSAFLARYVGLETYMRASASVAFMLSNIVSLWRVFELTEEQTDEQLVASCVFLTTALNLMTLPRPGNNSWLAGEPELVRHVRLFLPDISDMDYPAMRQLFAAWQRVLRSGVLRARGIDKGIEEVHQLHLGIRAAAHANLAAGRLLRCALPGCAAQEAHAGHFKRCAACRAVCYCSREHQTEHWPSHKAACKAARKAAAAEKGGAPGASGA